MDKRMRTTIITPTVGTKKLQQAIESVQNQTVPCKHIVVVDGKEHFMKAMKVFRITGFKGQTLVLEENTGGKWAGYRWNGHRIYAGIPAMVNTDFVSFLDEDNWFEPDFVEKMQAQMGDNLVVTCRRKVHCGKYLGVDNFESVGETDFGYCLYDTNTYLFNTVIYNKYFARHFYYPLGADKLLSKAVIESEVPQVHIETPLVNYRAPKRLEEFFKLNCTKP